MTIASIDIGTNTVLMVIADYEESSGKITTLANLHNVPRIGKGLIKGNPVAEEKIKLLYEILGEYKAAAANYNCNKIIATATNAFRIASNSDRLCFEIKEKFDIDINIVSGEEESYYSYLGATLETGKNEKTLVIDIGGGSTEIIAGKGDEIFFMKSFQTGVVSSTESYFKNDPPDSGQINAMNIHIQNVFEQLNEMKMQADKAIAIAGTPTTLACIKQNLSEYNEEAIEGSILKKDEITGIIKELSHLSSEEISNKYKAVVKGREDVLLAGSLILFHLMNLLKLEKVIVSTKGIRYGAIKAMVKN